LKKIIRQQGGQNLGDLVLWSILRQKKRNEKPYLPSGTNKLSRKEFVQNTRIISSRLKTRFLEIFSGLFIFYGSTWLPTLLLLTQNTP
jgi:hypothetical protein